MIVTHNMQQAARVSDFTAFMYLGELIEFGATEKLFTDAQGQADPGLHHRPLRLSTDAEDSTWRANISSSATTRSWSGCDATICEMGGLAESQLANALQAVRERDAELAEQVIAATRRSTRSSSAIRSRRSSCWRCASRWRPICASSLSSIKIAADLERIGDYANNIAKRAIVLTSARRRRRP